MLLKVWETPYTEYYLGGSIYFVVEKLNERTFQERQLFLFIKCTLSPSSGHQSLILRLKLLQFNSLQVHGVYVSEDDMYFRCDAAIYIYNYFFIEKVDVYLQESIVIVLIDPLLFSVYDDFKSGRKSW